MYTRSNLVDRASTTPIELFSFMFEVEGDSAFPMKMLFHEGAVPADEQSAGNLGLGAGSPRRRVRLQVSHWNPAWYPNVAAWSQLGWTLIPRS